MLQGSFNLECNLLQGSIKEVFSLETPGVLALQPEIYNFATLQMCATQCKWVIMFKAVCTHSQHQVLLKWSTSTKNIGEHFLYIARNSFFPVKQSIHCMNFIPTAIPGCLSLSLSFPQQISTSPPSSSTSEA